MMARECGFHSSGTTECSACTQCFTWPGQSVVHVQYALTQPGQSDFRSFKGAWHQDKMHGCGVKLITDDSETTQQAGHFVDDEYVGPSNVCSVAAAHQASLQALAAAHLASGLQVCCRHPYLHLKVL